MRIFKLVLPCLFLSQCIFGQAERTVDHQNLLWTRYNNNLEITAKWSINSEFDNRIFTDPVEENLYLIRSVGRFKINSRFEFGVGLAYFSNNTQNPNITLGFHIPEYRGQQDFTWKEPLGKFIISQRWQVEERFIRRANKEELLSGTAYFWRFRYRIQAEYPFWTNNNHLLKGIISEEVMLNAGNEITHNVFDQNRLYAAVQYGWNKNFAFEMGYLNSFQQRANGIDFYNRNILRLTIFHKLKL